MRCQGVAIDTLRSRSARARRESHVLTRTSDTHHDDQPIEHIEDLLHLALADLSTHQRQLIELTYYAGHSYQAAAATLGIPTAPLSHRSDEP